MSHPKRISFPKAFYHISSKGNNGENIFIDKRDKLRYLKILKRYKNRFHFNIYAYCLMDNHVHLLLRTKEANISKIMHSINTSYTMYFNKKQNHKGHLFQGRYHSILVSEDEYLLTLIRYIHLNPVRAKIVQFPQEYFWSSYREYLSSLNLERAEIADVDFVLDYFGKNRFEQIKKFREFINQEIEKISEIESPFEDVKEYQFLGSDEFIKDINNISSYYNQANNSEDRKIIGEIIKHFGEERFEIIKRSKKYEDIFYRNLLMYILRILGNMSLKEIGIEFGGLNFSTVSKGLINVEKLILKDKKVFQLFSKIIAGRI